MGIHMNSFDDATVDISAGNVVMVCRVVHRRSVLPLLESPCRKKQFCFAVRRSMMAMTVRMKS